MSTIKSNWYANQKGFLHWEVFRLAPGETEVSPEWFWTRRGAQAHADFLNEEQAWADEVEREIYRQIDRERLADIAEAADFLGRNPELIGDTVILMRPRRAAHEAGTFRDQLGCS